MWPGYEKYKTRENLLRLQNEGIFCCVLVIIVWRCGSELQQPSWNHEEKKKKMQETLILTLDIDVLLIYPKNC